MYRIVVLPGDGIGPEVTQEAVKVLEAVGRRFGHRFVFTEDLIGGACIDRYGVALRPETIARCRRSAAVLLGAVGGPKWDDPQAPVRPEQGLLGLRKALKVYANLRPVRVYPPLVGASPLRPELLEGVDFVVVRELTGGLYFGRPKRQWEAADGPRAVDTCLYRAAEIERVLRVGYALARARRRKLTSVDKANVLATSQLWRRIATRLASEYPDVTTEHALVDSCAMHLLRRPRDFDVLVMENMFGDILTDEAAALAGSLGVMPRPAWARAGWGSTSRSTARRRTSPGGGSPTRWAPSSAPPCSCVTRSASRGRPRPSRPPWRLSWRAASGRPTSPGRASRPRPPWPWGMRWPPRSARWRRRPDRRRPLTQARRARLTLCPHAHGPVGYNPQQTGRTVR
jgi:3-isopropylmalate dehydrogenase